MTDDILYKDRTTGAVIRRRDPSPLIPHKTKSPATSGLRAALRDILGRMEPLDVIAVTGRVSSTRISEMVSYAIRGKSDWRFRVRSGEKGEVLIWRES